jgi:hypothetical protein
MEINEQISILKREIFRYYKISKNEKDYIKATFADMTIKNLEMQLRELINIRDKHEQENKTEQ